MTRDDLDIVADSIVDTIKGAIDPLKARLDVVAARLELLDSQPTLKYLGTWDAQQDDHPGEFVTDAGSLWHANRSTKSRPGSDGTWTLVAKRGRDGKDTR